MSLSLFSYMLLTDMTLDSPEVQNLAGMALIYILLLSAVINGGYSVVQMFLIIRTKAINSIRETEPAEIIVPVRENVE